MFWWFVVHFFEVIQPKIHQGINFFIGQLLSSWGISPVAIA